MRQYISVLKYPSPKFQANQGRQELTEHLSFRFVNLLVKNRNIIKRNAEDVLEANQMSGLDITRMKLNLCSYLFTSRDKITAYTYLITLPKMCKVEIFWKDYKKSKWH
jgi:hypothetical protein